MNDPIGHALAALRRGDVIGLPTETVYGLAADASRPEAVRRIFELKGRPADAPRFKLVFSYLPFLIKQVIDPFQKQHGNDVFFELRRIHIAAQ